MEKTQKDEDLKSQTSKLQFSLRPLKEKYKIYKHNESAHSCNILNGKDRVSGEKVVIKIIPDI